MFVKLKSETDYEYTISCYSHFKHSPQKTRKKLKIYKWNYFLYNSSEDYSSIPNGAKNGIMGGLEILLDAEAFDYSYW